jgi:ribosomal protein S12 methylthiotransferase
MSGATPATPVGVTGPVRVSVVTLGCGRNEVDSDQLGGALQAAGFRLVAESENADCVLVNTCAFIEAAREESVEAILDACDLPPGPRPDGSVGPPAVVVIGCMAQRYGAELAQALPEAAAVVGFDEYARLPDMVARVAGAASTAAPGAPGPAVSSPGLPIASVGPPARSAPQRPPTALFPPRTQPRGPWAYLKLASGCDRRCTFCAIPSFRGTFRSRPLEEVVAEARWLAAAGARELVCVSENTTSWGKDLDGGRALQPALLGALDGIDGLERVRLLYLQPDEVGAGLIDAMAASRVVAGYYDLSLQHASEPLLWRMARGGGAESFLGLIQSIRQRDPGAVFRSSFIVGFPGETDGDVEVLASFLEEAGLDWVGFFIFSPEEGTPSASMPDQLTAEEARARRDHLVEIAEGVSEERAARFVGRRLELLVEEQEGSDSVGRSYREAPETDGEVRLPGCAVPVGRMVPVEVTAASGVDLVARPVLRRAG